MKEKHGNVEGKEKIVILVGVKLSVTDLEGSFGCEENWWRKLSVVI